MKDRGLVLIADDNSLLCRTIGAALRSRGYRTISAKGGEEAALLAERRNPKAMIIDFMMPVMDGMETARAIKNNPKTSAIPIVLLSAAGNCEIERLSNGGDIWWSARLEKPITMQTLVRTIERVAEVDDVRSHDVRRTPHEAAARAYMRQTFERLDGVRMEMEPGNPTATISRAHELALRHTRRLRDGASEMNSPVLGRLATQVQSLLERGQEPGQLDEDGRGLLHSLVGDMATAIGLQRDTHVPVGPTASHTTAKTKVPWLLLVCDDADFSIAAASRARFYGICVNNVAQTELACGIARRYPFAAIAIAGSFASDAAELVDRLRRVSPHAPILVAGAGRADAHRAALKAGADRILPAGVQPERLIAACSELVHQSKPALGTVLAIAEDPALLGMIESQLIDLGCNVVSIPSLTALAETVEVVQPDLLMVDIGDSTEEYIAAISMLRSHPKCNGLPIVAIARDAAIAQSLAGRKDVAHDVVTRNRLNDQIRPIVFEIMRTMRSVPGIELDPTTGALGREAFLARGGQILEQAQVAGTQPVLAGVDVDTSALEARIGDGAADLMLKAVFQRMRETFSNREASIGRLDGGYFAILVADGNVADIRKEIALAASAFTPSVQIRTGASDSSGAQSFKQLLAHCMAVVEMGVIETSLVEADAIDETEPEATSEESHPVYIVEDDGVLRTILTEQLSKAGFECYGYADGSEALEALLDSRREGDTPVVLLDLDLPGLDGWSVLERLRTEKPDVFRTVIMTASEDEETELKGLRAGASDYVIKPVKVPVMVERIRRLIA